MLENIKYTPGGVRSHDLRLIIPSLYRLSYQSLSEWNSILIYRNIFLNMFYFYYFALKKRSNLYTNQKSTIATIKIMIYLKYFSKPSNILSAPDAIFPMISPKLLIVVRRACSHDLLTQLNEYDIFPSGDLVIKNFESQ